MAIPSMTPAQLARLGNLLKDGAAAALPAYGRNYNQSFGVRAVWVRNDGGSAGSSSTTCSLTYSIYHPGGAVLATALSPLRPRIPNVVYNIPANDTYGLAFKDGDGWQLVEALGETPQAENCA
jgi:hypothetical protein